MKTTTSTKTTEAALPKRNAKTGRFEKAPAKHVASAKPAAKAHKA
jgi:hypothetical protein